MEHATPLAAQDALRSATAQPSLIVLVCAEVEVVKEASNKFQEAKVDVCHLWAMTGAFPETIGGTLGT